MSLEAGNVAALRVDVEAQWANARRPAAERGAPEVLRAVVVSRLDALRDLVAGKGPGPKVLAGVGQSPTGIAVQPSRSGAPKRADSPKRTEGRTPSPQKTCRCRSMSEEQKQRADAEVTKRGTRLPCTVCGRLYPTTEEAAESAARAAKESAPRAPSTTAEAST
jgi:hypothetical protein